MELNEYADKAMSTAIYPSMGDNLVYPALKLNGEAGEVAEKVGKMLRDDDGDMTPERRESLAKELGDVMWYVAALCHELGVTMEYVAQINIEKLLGRKERRSLKGDGDDR